MPRIRLNHNCGKPGCVGLPGDVIEVTESDAKYLLSRGGGTLVDEPLRRAIPEVADDDAPAESTKAEKKTPANAGSKKAETAEKR